MTTNRTGRALLVVDVQNDFCEGGSLAVAGGLEVGTRISEHLAAHAGDYDLVVASRDWHTPGSTNQGHFAADGEEPDFTTTWPVHCVAGTPGAEYAPTLRTDAVTHHVRKGQDAPAYSMFEAVTDDGDGLPALLEAHGVGVVDVVGIATDYCVRATVLDARANGLEVTVLAGMVAAVDPATGTAAAAEMRSAGAGWEEAPVNGYDSSEYPPFAVTVDLAVLTVRAGALSVLLVERDGEPYAGSWALPGGFVGEEEDAETSAWRELAEETGVERFSGHLEQLRTYSAPDRDPRMRVVSVAQVALAPDLPEPVAGSDARNARWWAVSDVLEGEARPELAFDHLEILLDAVERVRAKLEYTTLATEFVTEPFTIADLHRVYTAVWGVAPDLGNFRRKVLKTPGFVVPTDQKGAGEPTGGPRPLLFRRGGAATLQPAMLRPDV